MPKLIAHDFLTLDGVMQAPGLEDEDPSGGFEHGGWQGAYYDDVFGEALQAWLNEADGFIFGRRTYEIFAAHWPRQPADDPLARIFNERPKYVVSRTLTDPLPWQNATVLTGDVPTEIARLRQGSGKALLVLGSNQLVETLMRHDLVDEYRLMIHPLLLGSGKRLFGSMDHPVRLHLRDTRTTPAGVLLLSYVPA